MSLLKRVFFLNKFINLYNNEIFQKTVILRNRVFVRKIELQKIGFFSLFLFFSGSPKQYQQLCSRHQVDKQFRLLETVFEYLNTVFVLFLWQLPKWNLYWRTNDAELIFMMMQIDLSYTQTFIQIKKKQENNLHKQIICWCTDQSKSSEKEAKHFEYG